MAVVCIKLHVSNIWSQLLKKLSNTEGVSWKKMLLIEKKRVSTEF